MYTRDLSAKARPAPEVMSEKLCLELLAPASGRKSDCLQTLVAVCLTVRGQFEEMLWSGHAKQVWTGKLQKHMPIPAIGTALHHK